MQTKQQKALMLRDLIDEVNKLIKELEEINVDVYISLEEKDMNLDPDHFMIQIKLDKIEQIIKY